MTLQEIDVFHIEPLETRFDGVEDVLIEGSFSDLIVDSLLTGGVTFRLNPC